MLNFTLGVNAGRYTKCNPQLYVCHYLDQTGGGNSLPYFQGRVRQDGYGLGSIFAGLAKSALPFLENTAMPLFKHAGKENFRTGAQVLGDVLD